MRSVAFLLLSIVFSKVLCEPTIYFKEEFGPDFTERWVESTFKGAEQGKFTHSAGKFFNDAEKDKGIQTSQDARFYGISALLDKPFSNEEKTLVIQFQVKHEQSIDCGGGYIKVLGPNIDRKNFHGDTPYNIMFGPDICGMTKRVHVIFTYKGKNHLIKKEIRCKDDELSHLYTLIVRPDNTYEVLIDNEKAESGSLESDWDFLPPKLINDPKASKPADWDDREKIEDVDDKKPEDWDKPKTIPDANAKKPDDWDDEMDGEWEPPQIDNPEYKGEWKPKEIPNPAYKGSWVHPQIENPEYQADTQLYLQKELGSVGFDLWQVKSGTIFDNVLITDDPEYAKQYGEETWRKTAEGEKKMKEAHDEKERKKFEEDEKKRKEEEEAKKASEPAEEKKDTEEEPADKTEEEKHDEL
jgi:calreticulin